MTHAPCAGGHHAIEIISEAVASGHGWLAVSDSKTAVTSCFFGNAGTLGAFFRELADAAAERSQPTDCRYCNANIKALAAAMDAYKSSMRESGFSQHGACN